jgi:hypothetical protein
MKVASARAVKTGSFSGFIYLYWRAAGNIRIGDVLTV